MVDWVMTATTIYCDAVRDEVTLMISADGTSRCTGYNKYFKPTGETSVNGKNMSEQSGETVRCEGIDCYRVVQYRDKLLSEEDKDIQGSTDGK